MASGASHLQKAAPKMQLQQTVTQFQRLTKAFQVIVFAAGKVLLRPSRASLTHESGAPEFRKIFIGYVPQHLTSKRTEQHTVLFVDDMES
jgi:hypothetical protein